MPAFAYSAVQLRTARGHAEVCGGSAHVVDIALKVRVLGKLLGFAQYGFVASGGYCSALMKGQRAKAARAEAAA